MSDGPTVDGRDRAELLAELRQRANNYTDEWDPHTDDAGTTLLLLFSRFGTDVINRLNDVPHKHRVAFLNALDFDRRPPQSARVPLTFTTTADIESNVVVHGGTQVLAETDDGETVTFEVPQDEGFEATPAALQSVYSVTPESNSIYSHTTELEREDDIRLFSGTDLQKHHLYLGHDDLLNLERGSTLSITIQSPDSETLEEQVEWEYFGESADGAVGWHHLPLDTGDAIADPLDEEVALGEKMQRVSDQIQRLGEESAEQQDESRFEAAFSVPGQIEQETVAGVDTRWIRGQIAGETEAEFEIDIESISLSVEGGGDETTEARPSMVFSNDVPLSITDGDFYPFGRLPQPPTTLYLASEEAFTKKEGSVDIQFAPPESDAAEKEGADDETAQEENGPGLLGERGGPLAGPPEISWEYWNGNGWTQLILEANETEGFQSAGEITFTVPADLTSTTVSGHNDYWIRARLVSGNYGQPQYEITDDGTRGDLIQEPNPPMFGDITLRYEQQERPFENIITDNNVTYREAHTPEHDSLTAGTGEPLVPFTPLPDEKQTLYLGFDAPLRDGPLNLHIPMQDKTYPRGFEPGIRWEYCPNPESWHWEKLDVYDGTEGLTERGIVSINFPTPTTEFELFGTKRHWIRATVTREEFVTTASDSPAGRGERPTESGRTVEQGSRAPPTLSSINPNTQWAYNERTITETLGESDGSPAQRFRCDQVPITEATVWIDEGDSLTGSEQRALEKTRPNDVRREQGRDTDEFWVRWTEVPDFLDSGEESRHYRLDRTNGIITFGDGQEGAIPPTGEDNVEAIYQTGGGSDGNVDVGAVTDLRSSISRIDSVTNRKPSDGGTDIESLEQAIVRAPQRIKNRGRAVSAEDFEQIARDASRQLATVRCEPGMDDTGEQTPGWVTLLVIPRERRERPTPSLELRQRVKESVSECSPATLVGHETKRIVVRGPDYAEVSVETTIHTQGVESITNLKSTIEATLSEFFHPLTGNKNGDGWAFGRAPRLSQISTLVESTAGVDHVSDIAMTIETANEEKIIRDPEKRPFLARDEMISSGTHDVTVIMRGQR